MVVHQAAGVNLKAGGPARFGQGLEAILPVHFIPEVRLPPVSPAQDMVYEWMRSLQFWLMILSRHDSAASSSVGGVHGFPRLASKEMLVRLARVKEPAKVAAVWRGKLLSHFRTRPRV